MTANEFYDSLTPFYHLIYPDWESAIAQQSAQLDSLIWEYWGNSVNSILDVSCGIGTQVLGLAQLGYRVTGSDLSSQEIERAQREAQQRGLTIDFSVADMRQAFTHHSRQFDIVIACDNAVPHLLTDEDILTAFRQFYLCTRPGGGCLLSVRDYDREALGETQVKPYGIRRENGRRYFVFQVWEFHGKIYDVSMYFVEDRGRAECQTYVMRSQYYAVSSQTLIALMGKAGFQEVQRLDHRFFQPVILGKKPN